MEANTGSYFTHGNNLQLDLPRMYPFDKPIFTPTMKSKDDEPVLAKATEKEFPGASKLTWRFYRIMEAYLHHIGITLIDAKMEADEELLLDEFGTGDTCRMALSSTIQDGVDPPFLDKEVLRKSAEEMWNGGAKVPLTFSDVQIAQGIKKYHEAFELITGTSLAEFQRTKLAYRNPDYA